MQELAENPQDVVTPSHPTVLLHVAGSSVWGSQVWGAHPQTKEDTKRDLARAQPEQRPVARLGNPRTEQLARMVDRRLSPAKSTERLKFSPLGDPLL